MQNALKDFSVWPTLPVTDIKVLALVHVFTSL